MPRSQRGIFYAWTIRQMMAPNAPTQSAMVASVWIAGRVLYMFGYSQAAAKRSRGYGIQALAAIVLWVGALGAIVWRLVQA